MSFFETNTDLFKYLGEKKFGSEDEWNALKLPDTFSQLPSPSDLMRSLLCAQGLSRNAKIIMFRRMVSGYPDFMLKSQLNTAHLKRAALLDDQFTDITQALVPYWDKPNKILQVLRKYPSIDVKIFFELFYDLPEELDGSPESITPESTPEPTPESTQFAHLQKQALEALKGQRDIPFEQLVNLYHADSLAISTATESDHESERLFERFFSFLIALIDRRILAGLGLSQTDSKITHCYDQSIPWLTSIHTNETEDEAMSSFKPDGIAFLLEQLIYAFQLKEYEPEKETRETHEAASLQLLNSLKLPPASTNFNLIYFTSVGYKAKIHVNSLNDNYVRPDGFNPKNTYDLVELDQYRRFITHFCKLIVLNYKSARQTKNASGEQPQYGTHIISCDNVDTYVLKCYSSFETVIPLFRQSLDCLQQHQQALFGDEFVLQIQSSQTEATKSSTSGVNASKFSSGSLVPSCISHSTKQSFFCAQFKYVLGTEFNKDKLQHQQVFKSIFTILTKLHSVGLTHNDIRRPNIVIQTNSDPFLIDYGFCISTEKLEREHVDSLFNVLSNLLTFQNLIEKLSSHKHITTGLNQLKAEYPNLLSLQKKLLVVNDIYSALNIYSGPYEKQIAWLCTNWSQATLEQLIEVSRHLSTCIGTDCSDCLEKKITIDQ